MNYPIRNYAQIDKDMRSIRVWDRGAWLSPHTREHRFRRDMVVPTVKELREAREQDQIRRRIREMFGADAYQIPHPVGLVSPLTVPASQIREDMKALLATMRSSDV